MDNTNGYRQLAAAIILQAVKEAKRKNGCEAAEWLMGEDCENYCFWLDIDHASIVRKVKAWRTVFEAVG